MITMKEQGSKSHSVVSFGAIDSTGDHSPVCFRKKYFSRNPEQCSVDKISYDMNQLSRK